MSVALTSISLSACATGEKKNISTAKPNIHFDDFAKLSLVDIMHWSVRGFDFLPPGNNGQLTVVCARGVGNLNRKCQVVPAELWRCLHSSLSQVSNSVKGSTRSTNDVFVCTRINAR